MVFKALLGLWKNFVFYFSSMFCGNILDCNNGADRAISRLLIRTNLKKESVQTSDLGPGFQKVIKIHFLVKLYKMD